jgi:hypothetical protein
VRRKIRRPSAAMVVACLALLVALGGTSVAAVAQLVPRNSVGTPQLKRNAVTAPKIAPNAVRTGHVLNGSLLAEDFKAGQIPQGPQGPPGPAGPAGPAGPGGKYALVAANGSIIHQSGGISLAGTAGNWYYLNMGSDMTNKNIQVTSAYRNDDGGFRGGVMVTQCGGPPSGSNCSISDNVNTIAVGIESTTNAAIQPHAFYIAVF